MRPARVRLGPAILEEPTKKGECVVRCRVHGVDLRGKGASIEEARKNLEGLVSVFRALHSHVSTEIRTRKLSPAEAAEFARVVARRHLRAYYPMISLQQVRNEMKRLAEDRQSGVSVKLVELASKIYRLAGRVILSG